MLGPAGPKLVAPDAVVIQEGIKLALGNLGNRLADNMEWALVTSDTVAVLTSDEPVCWWSPSAAPTNYANARVVWLPLSPRAILQLRDRDVDLLELGLPLVANAAGRDDLVRLVNGHIASQAHRWIIHHPHDHPLDGIQMSRRTARAS